MTNKEAAEFIWDVLDGVKSFNEEGGRGLEALELAIKALKNEKAKESEIIKAYTKGFDTGVGTVKNERPKGEWIITGEEQGALGMIYKIKKCDKCGWEHSLVIPDNFCPRCGANMQKGGAE